MGWFGNVLKSLAPVAGSALGSLALPGIGSALGLDIGSGLGGALGGGLAGALTGQDPVSGGLSGGLEGYFLGPAIDSALGLNTATSLTSPSSPSGFGLGSALGLGGGTGGDITSTPMDSGTDLRLNWGDGSLLSGGSGGNTNLDTMLGSLGTGAGAAGGAIAPAAANAVAGAAGGSDTGGGGLMSMFQKNPALLMGLVGAGSQLLGGSQQTPAEKQLQKQAKLAASGANGLVTAASTGKLPAGAEAAWQSALNDTLTSIRSKYANLGLSGSTMESQELSAAQERAAGLKYQMATEATQTGLNALGLSNQIYGLLMQNQLQSDSNLSNAIGNFASALGGGQGSTRQAA